MAGGRVHRDTGIYFEGDVPMPLLAMYGRTRHCTTISQQSSRPRFPWSQAADVWPRLEGKTVITRDRVLS
jgi:hypothetical protein